MSGRSVEQGGFPPSLPASPFPFDLDGVLCQLNSAFNPLHRDFMLDFHISGARDGYVYLSIALPEGMTRVFVSLLESLHGFARFMDIKARSAVSQDKAKFVDHVELQRREKVHAEFSQQVCFLYDGFLGQGYPTKEAVKMTNSALKAKNHPWATHDIVLKVLRSAGRFRKKKAHP
jgi:hypothetical protein